MKERCTLPAYANAGGNSSVLSYDDSQPSQITVTFRSGRWRNYVYTDASAGPANVARMKQLAAAGQGLGSFINTHVRYAYASRS